MERPEGAVSYGAVWKLPHARETFGAALLGRLGYGMNYVALVLTLARALESVALAGLTATVFGTLAVVAAPARAALIDRWGVRRGLPALALPFAGALLALAAYASAPGRPDRVVVTALAVAAGSSCPPLGPTMRAVWAALAPQEALLQRAFSLDTIAEELLFLSGPLLVVAVGPAPGLALSATLVAVGSCAMAALPSAHLVGRRAGNGEPARRLRLFTAEGAGVRRAAYAALGVGACLGGLDLYVIASAARAHHAGAVGWILAGQSAGSAVGGLLHGRVAWRRSAAARLPYLLTALAALLALNALAPNLPVLALGVVATGSLLAPTLSTAYLAAARLAPEGTATRATTWVNSAINAGSSAGGALAALLVARAPIPLGFLLTAAAPTLAALASRGPRRRTGAGDTAPQDPPRPGVPAAGGLGSKP